MKYLFGGLIVGALLSIQLQLASIRRDIDKGDKFIACMIKAQSGILCDEMKNKSATAKAIEAFGRGGTARSRRDESAGAQPFAERKPQWIN